MFIGAVTFTGSIVANLKLSAKMKSAPLVLPGKNLINVGTLVLFAAFTVWFIVDPRLWLLIVVTILALALGWHLPPTPAEHRCAVVPVCVCSGVMLVSSQEAGDGQRSAQDAA